MDDPDQNKNKLVATKIKKSKNGKNKVKVGLRKGKSGNGLGDLQAAQRAVKDRKSVATGSTFQVALSRIVVNHNYRTEPANLASMGYNLINKDDPERSLVDMCLSSDMDTVRSAVALFEVHEGQSDTDGSDKKNVGKDKKKSIISLANSIVKDTLIQPISLRRGTGENRELISGQRRVAAVAYLHAKSRCEIADEVEGAKLVPAAIKAMVLDITADQAWLMAVAENSNRQDDNPIQEGMLYKKILAMIDPETDKRYTLEKAGKLMGVDKSRVRSYAALTNPKRIIQTADGPKRLGLTDEEREDIRTGKKTRTWGIRTALGEKHYSEGKPQVNRDKPIPLKAMQNLFDDTDETNAVRRLAIAECMGFEGSDAGLNEAAAQSELRIAEQEGKKLRGKRHTEESEEETDTDDE